jgi:hypothetical protein
VAALLRRAAIRLRNLPPLEVINDEVERKFQQLMRDMNAPD